MADRKISEFTDGGLVQSGDEIATVRGGDNVKVSFGSAAALDSGQSVGDLVVLEDDGGGNPALPSVSGAQLTDLPFTPDPTVQVSADDTTSGYLEDKITGSASITVTKEIDSAGVESLRLDVAGAGGVVEIADGGTGATTAAGARTNLGLSYADVIATTEIIGLTVSNNTTTPNSLLDIAAGRCWSSDQTTNMVLASSVTIDITDTDDGNDGATAIGNSESFYVFIVADSSGTNPTTAKWSKTLTPTFTGYDKMRYRLGFKTDSSGNIRALENFGNIVEYTDTSLVDIDVPSLSTSVTAYSVSCPSGVPVLHTGQYGLLSGSATSVRARSPLDVDTSAPAAKNNDLRCGTNSTIDSNRITLLTDTGQITLQRGETEVGQHFVMRTTSYQDLAAKEFN